MNNARGMRIDTLILNTADLAAARDFYVEALGFTPEEGASANRATLRLGEQTIVLERASGGAPYPSPMAANDPWFQHFAIVVSDMAAAYTRLSRFAHTPISRGGPQLLPASTGGVTAYKFRDPEGHPLELSRIPGSEAWAAAAQARPDAVFLGVDHTAVAALDLDDSVSAYRSLGFTEGPRFLNTGPEQDRLDGLDGVVLDIATVMPPGGGPHIELLHYRSPLPAKPRRLAGHDIAATRTVLADPGGAERERVLATRNGGWVDLKP